MLIQHYLLTIIFTVVSFFADITAVVAMPINQSCKNIFSNLNIQLSPKIKIQLTEKIRTYRSRKIRKSNETEFLINNKIYEVIGLLGEGTAQVYLAHTQDGNLVSIKKISPSDELSPNWVNSIFYEIAVTKYYNEAGLNVPRIIDYKITKTNDAHRESLTGYLVKELKLGITVDELNDRGFGFLYGRPFVEINQARQNEVNKLRVIHKGFKNWLKNNGINLYLHKFENLDSLIQYGDFDGLSYRNWIFDVDTFQWILFDP